MNKLNWSNRSKVVCSTLIISSIGGAGELVTDYGHMPWLRNILPNAYNYFQHSGNLLWSGYAGGAAVLGTALSEKFFHKPCSRMGRIATAAVLSVGVSLPPNAVAETGIIYDKPASFTDAPEGATRDLFDLYWGVAGSVVAAGIIAAQRDKLLHEQECQQLRL